MKHTRGRHTSERGESLVEVLIAVAIMGIAVVAIMGGLTTSVLVSDVHRKQTTAGTVVRAYAEAIEHSVADGNYVACAPAGSYASPAGFTVPSGYPKSVVAGSMRYWNGTAWQTSCSTDSGVQRLQIQVASDDGRATETVMVVLRKPCRLGDAPCS